MPISNGYDTQKVMNELFGRIKWRSLNQAGSFTNNATFEVPRANLFLTVGLSAGLTAGGNSYTDSSLIGWTYQALNSDGSVIATTNLPGSFTLETGVWTAGQQLFISFKSNVQVPKSAWSGRYYEQFHPMVSTSYLGSVIDPLLAPSNVPTPGFLGDLEQGCIMALLNGVFNRPQMMEDTLIYDRKLRQDNAWTNSGKFCGYRIMIAPGEFAARIVKASFIFNGAATFNLYVYQDMQLAPIYVTQVTTIANQEVYVDLQDWALQYSQTYSQGGVFYIGYYQNDLGAVQALDQFVSQWNKTFALGYTAFETPATGATSFNRIAIPYTFVTYGMNLRVETYTDFTARIVKNASMFDQAIGLAMAVIVLGYEAMNTRTNGSQRELQNLATTIYGEINSAGPTDNSPYVAGLKMQLSMELKKINDNFFKRKGVETTRPPVWDDSSNLQGVFS